VASALRGKEKSDARPAKRVDAKGSNCPQGHLPFAREGPGIPSQKSQSLFSMTNSPTDPSIVSAVLVDTQQYQIDD
jgi:hypothetical protein